MPARSLLKLATNACVANLRHLFDVGEAPYHVVRPILLKLENPDQLRRIEKASPQICIADAEIWQGFIRRDIPNWENKRHEPKDPKNWWKVYRKLKREADEESTQRAAALKAELNQLSAKKESQHITFDHSLTVPAKRRFHAPPKPQPRATDASAVTFRQGSKTKMTTGKSILAKARREAREARDNHFGTGAGAMRMSRPVSATTTAPTPRPATNSISEAVSAPSPPRSDQQRDSKTSVQASREEAMQRRERALAQQRAMANTTGAGVSAASPPAKRPANNVFMPTKKRKF